MPVGNVVVFLSVPASLRLNVTEVRSDAAQIEPIVTPGVPTITNQALAGPDSTVWESNHRLDIVWDRLDTVHNRWVLEIVGHVSEAWRLLALRSLSQLCNGTYQVPKTQAGDLFGAATGLEAFYIE